MRKFNFWPYFWFAFWTIGMLMAASSCSKSEPQCDCLRSVSYYDALGRLTDIRNTDITDDCGKFTNETELYAGGTKTTVIICDQ